MQKKKKKKLDEYPIKSANAVALFKLNLKASENDTRPSAVSLWKSNHHLTILFTAQI